MKTNASLLLAIPISQKFSLRINFARIPDAIASSEVPFHTAEVPPLAVQSSVSVRRPTRDQSFARASRLERYPQTLV